LIEHDPATHAATISIHTWLKQRLALVLGPPLPPSPRRSYAGVLAVKELICPAARKKREQCPKPK